MTASTFPEMVRRIFTQQSIAFTINLLFGVMLRPVETGELRYYHPSQNNTRFFDVPHWIQNEEDLDFNATFSYIVIKYCIWCLTPLSVIS
jgi:hypothetical protein